MDGTDRTRPVVTYALIGSCFLLFAVGPASGLATGGSGAALRAAQDAWFGRWGVVPRELFGGGPRALVTPLTALFLHSTWLHLAGNLLFLFVFGDMVERRMGRLRFAVFYLATGYAAMLCYAASHPGSGETLVGASGAVSAVLGAFLRLFPRARVTSVFPFLLFLPLRFPAWAVLLFWLTLQWLAVRRDADGPGVAYLAHVAGFTLGFLAAWRQDRRARVTGPAPAPEGETPS
ncbi:MULTISPECIES: rhomboid family intramembrane serine protease [Streptomyces]|uniref:Rhomboid family intramembrane serine protease n=1 Tax=Streptomyces cacaoi TaxID=1898 RepID=A0A4Y3R4N7_STRCI|nr:MULTISPECIES: rhomboid family intramembrane serine protease [Streptomyces]QHF93901.1 rhomboid family intramembrane serine protease [Streptomyces sp. NHF165]GEB52269.1 rhomboid family intramembrane serine protease [Streptomyces cacaoi]